MAKTSKAEALKQGECYLLNMKDDSQKKITVPPGCTVTFGALIPGQGSNAGRLGLRVWKGKAQLAVFTDVLSFRALSLTIEERITTTKEETFTKGDGESAQAVVVATQVHEWVDPDKPKPTGQKLQQNGEAVLRLLRED